MTDIPDEDQEEPQTVDDSPLMPFQADEDRRCPKCRYAGIKTQYHASVTKGEALMTACEELLYYLNPLLSLGEHLCRRCSGCGYGWTEKTADA